MSESNPSGGSRSSVISPKVIQAYRFALDPTPSQAASLRSHCGAQRFAYNWGLARIKANLDQRAAEATYGVNGSEATELISWSAYHLRKEWNRAKAAVAPWWAENSKEAYASGLANLAGALKNWSDSRTGKRRGRRVGFPRFKNRRSACSCRFTTGSIGLSAVSRRHVVLPRIGSVRTCESTRKLARHLDRCSACIRSATVAFRSGRWFVSFSVEIARATSTPTRPQDIVGVDVGVRMLAVLSNGELIPNPRILERELRRLRRLQRRVARRRGPDRSTQVAPSNRWRKASARVGRTHGRIANARRDGLHKLTSSIARRYGTVVVEDLNVAAMVRNRRLARQLGDAGFAEVRRQLAYKTSWSGGRLWVADRWYPSSKKCSSCGVVKAKLRLGERVFRCGQCGFALDRDVNAARNLAALVEESAASCVGTRKMPAGNPRKSCAAQASGTATGRPASCGVGQPCRSNSTGQDTPSSADWTV